MDSSHSCWASRASSSRSRDESERESVSRECTEPDMAASVKLVAAIHSVRPLVNERSLALPLTSPPSPESRRKIWRIPVEDTVVLSSPNSSYSNLMQQHVSRIRDFH